MTLKAIVCGEGPTDVGVREYGSGVWNNGPAISFINNTSPIELLIDGISLTELENKVPILQRRKPKGFGTKALRLSRYAKMNNIDVAICYVDCDKKQDIDLFAKRYQEINDGFKQAVTGVVGIAMIPKRMIESWLLSDENSYKSLFGKIPEHPRLPNKPEELKGDKHDPDSDYPKHYIKRVLDQYNQRGTAWYYDLASNSAIDTLRRKCPISFEQFYQDINTKLAAYISIEK
jgi:hypothetical protein